MSRFQRMLAWGLGPCSALRLVVFRRLLALTLLIYTLAWIPSAEEWLSDEGFHASPAASDGLQVPLPLLPIELVPVFAFVYVASLAMIVLDWWPRTCSWLAFVGLMYATFADRLAAFSMNKIALVAWAVLLATPWILKKRGESASETEPARIASAWPLRILQATLILQYFGAGLCKLRGAWLEHDDVLFLQVQSIYMTDIAAWAVRELPAGAWAAMQHGALAFELLAPVLFCVARLRPVAFAWGLLMHLGIGLLMYKVGYFSAFVVGFYVLFVDEATLLRARERVLAWLA